MKIAKVHATPEEIAKLYGDSKDSSKTYIMDGVHDKQLRAVDNDTANDCFELFESEEKLKATMINPANIWAHYVFKHPINPETQLRYESFFSGFLYFYDTESRNGMSDHTIWLDWQKNKSKKDVVTVYLYPAPLRHQLKPPKINRATKTPEDYVKLMDDKNKEMKDTIYKTGWTPPWVSGYQSDPPSPQGPPPPYPA